MLSMGITVSAQLTVATNGYLSVQLGAEAQMQMQYGRILLQ